MGSVAPAEFIEIGKILRAGGGLFGEDEIGFAEVVDGNFVLVGDEALWPSGRESETGDGGEEINLAGRTPEAELEARGGEV